MSSRRNAQHVRARLTQGIIALVLVVATIVVIAQPAGRPMIQAIGAKLGVGQIDVPAWSCRVPASSVPHKRVLVLYDSVGRYAAYGAQSAALAANLASHSGRPVRQPVTSYRAGEMARYAAVVYVGTNYGEPLPPAFLADVRSGVRPVLWLGGTRTNSRTRPTLAATAGGKARIAPAISSRSVIATRT